jgi:ketosteroid isomerase-like protein
MRVSLLVGAMAVTLSLAGCRASAPRFTADDEKAVRDIADLTVASFKARNFQAWLDLWTDDAVLQPPNALAIVDRAGRDAWSKQFPVLEALRFGNVTVSGDGDIAYGTTTYMLKPKAAPADSGKQLFIARRQRDGKWKLVAVSFSSDLPLPSAAREPAPTLAGEPRSTAFTAADSSAIVALNTRLARAALSHDMRAWGAEYAANPQRMPPNARTVTGKAAADALNRSFPNVTRFQIAVLSLSGEGATAVATGEYRDAAPAGTDASGRPTAQISDEGKFMQQLARQPDGTWKIVRDIWNSNLPAAPGK